MRAYIATSAVQRRAARALIARRYAWRGYLVGDDVANARYITLLAAGRARRVLGTLTLGLDSSTGLLADESNRSAIDLMRAKGRRVCELVRLAVDEGASSRKVLASLFHRAYVLARVVHEMEELFIEVNPRHVGFYKRSLGFAVAAEPAICPRVRAPSVLLHVGLSMPAEERILGRLLARRATRVDQKS